MTDCKNFNGKTVVIIAAAGSGERLGLGYNKVLARANGKTMLEHTIDRFDGLEIVVAASSADLEIISKLLNGRTNIHLVEGGATRTQTVQAALQLIVECKTVLIHDGARPNIGRGLIDRIIQAANTYGSAIPYLPVTDTIKRLENRVDEDSNSGVTRVSNIIREGVISIQTPQGFDYKKLMEAYKQLSGQSFTDDSLVYEAVYDSAHYVEGESTNYKITYIEDLKRWEQELSYNKRLRVGYGYDIHRLVEGRKLVLGGVDIAYPYGLDGHSDADVAVHSVMDALLSAAGLKDIGTYFPDTDPQYKGIDSIKLLQQVGELVGKEGYYIGNISLVIIAEKPKLKEYIDMMRENISKALTIPVQDISIAASTNEKLDAIGRQEGIAAMCTVLLR